MIVRHGNKRINLENCLSWELKTEPSKLPGSDKDLYSIEFIGEAGGFDCINFEDLEQAKKVMANIDNLLMQKPTQEPMILPANSIPI